VAASSEVPHQLRGRAGLIYGTLALSPPLAVAIVAAIAAVQRAGLIPTIVGMGVAYVVATIGMFFNPALRGMDVRHEPVAEPTDVRAAAQDGETMVAARTTDIH
jgi:hypothetical protein